MMSFAQQHRRAVASTRDAVDLLGLLRDTIDNLSTRPVSYSLTNLATLAAAVGHDEIQRWTALEADGYFNDNRAAIEGTKVPDYRQVAGQYFDGFGRPFVIPDPQIRFIQQVPLRQPVAELEAMISHDGMLSLSDPRMLGFLREQFNAPVAEFRFAPGSVQAVLGAIRNRMHRYLVQLGDHMDALNAAGSAPGPAPDDLRKLHSVVQDAASPLFVHGHYGSAVLEACKAFNSQVQAKSGRRDLDGVSLMQTVFSSKQPLVKVSDHADEVLGFQFLFAGAMLAIRNPHAHKQISLDRQTAFEWLCFVSALLRVLDGASVAAPDATAGDQT